MKASDFECPTCGAEVSPNATGCRSCGAEKIDGRWVDPAAYDGLDLPDDDDEFDYDDFIAREFGGAPKKKGKDIFWWVIAVIVLVAFAAIAFRVR
ncbi:MAG: hypothetical protein HRU46_16550 [Verrucomicrobiales bacterium]|nr:hypothetical protein [Verrucomicrobiales bacterium]